MSATHRLLGVSRSYRYRATLESLHFISTCDRTSLFGGSRYPPRARPIALDLKSLQAKLLGRGSPWRLLLRAIIRFSRPSSESLGFAVTRLAARVRFGSRPRSARGRDTCCFPLQIVEVASRGWPMSASWAARLTRSDSPAPERRGPSRCVDVSSLRRKATFVFCSRSMLKGGLISTRLRESSTHQSIMSFLESLHIDLSKSPFVRLPPGPITPVPRCASHCMTAS